MIIYVRFEEVGTEYYAKAVTEISLTPFKHDCYYLDLDLSDNTKIYNTTEGEGLDEKLDIFPYNCEIVTWGFYNPKTSTFVMYDDEFSEEEADDYSEYAKVEIYKKGVLIKTKYTQDV